MKGSSIEETPTIRDDPEWRLLSLLAGIARIERVTAES